MILRMVTVSQCNYLCSTTAFIAHQVECKISARHDILGNNALQHRHVLWDWNTGRVDYLQEEEGVAWNLFVMLQAGRKAQRVQQLLSGFPLQAGFLVRGVH